MKNNRHNIHSSVQSEVELHVPINSTLTLKIDKEECIITKALERGQ